MAPRLLPIVHRNDPTVSFDDFCNGLTALFGLDEIADQTLTARRDRGGPPLGYPIGNEGHGHSDLRKASRVIDGNATNLEELFQKALIAQLRAVVSAYDFHYTRRYERDVDRVSVLTGYDAFPL